MRIVLSLAAVLFVLALLLAARLHHDHRRRSAIRRLLDSADALEAQLRAARSEIEAVAGDHENPVRRAMQDLLRQRLWLQEHAASASLSRLNEVRSALDQARTQIEAELQRIERARGTPP